MIILIKTRAIDLESLSIKIGELSWELTLDLVLINNDGNILDCMNYAALASLSRFKLPSFSLDNKLNTFTTISKNSGKKIFLNHLPILMSFAILNSDRLVDNNEEKTNDFFVFDPTVSYLISG